MKKIFLFAIILTGLASCKQAADVPQIDLTLSKALKDNAKLNEFVIQAKENANNLARECVNMHETAKEYLEVDFDSLNPEQQEKIVSLDYKYVEMWYNFNVKYTSQTMQLLEYLKDESIPKEVLVEMSKAMAQVSSFVQQLKDTYGQDLKLDPHAVPVQ
ncbi:MAG: hypothetical protein GX474_06930 [Bacteroidales bacterium]|jgi:hypothetical protein|nr:hypothetical protein [Bacteroidales bacterium]